jgi:hypothetical protein
LLDRFFDGPDAAAMRKTKSVPTPTTVEGGDTESDNKAQTTAEFPKVDEEDTPSAAAVETEEKKEEVVADDEEPKKEPAHQEELTPDLEAKKEDGEETAG